MRILLPAFFCLSALANESDINPLCKEKIALKAPLADQPPESLISKMKDCNSEAEYYGIGRPVDFVKARHCAFAQIKNNDGAVFGGDAILMMIYANGKGVSKNMPLAMKFACQIESAEAELESRLKHLEEIADSKDADSLDLCDDITSGFMMGHCAGHKDRLQEVKRGERLRVVMSGWSASEKKAFERLQAASDRFTRRRSDDEIDKSGSARGQFVIEEAAIQKLDFIESLEKLEKKKAPRYSVKQLKEEDNKLNELYKKLEKLDANEGVEGTITFKGVKATQKAWLEYRDAWIAFAKLRYPEYPSESISAWFTKKRNHMLNSLLGYL